MFATMQVILCTIYVLILVSEIVTEKNAAACFQKEANKRIREREVTAKEDITKSPNSEKSKEENLTDKESLHVTTTDFMEIITKSSSLENVKQEDENSIGKETNITGKARNSEGTKKIEENSTEIASAVISESLDHGNTKKEEKSSEKESSITTTEKQKINEENSLKKEDLTKNESTIMVHSEYTKTEETELVAKKSVEANLRDSTQKSSIEKSESKIKAKRQIVDGIETRRVFLKAFKNCRLMSGDHYLRVNGINVAESNECVVTELRKLENYAGEYTKLLDNSGIVRKE